MASALTIARTYEALFYEGNGMPRAAKAALNGDMDVDLPIATIAAAIEVLGEPAVMTIIHQVPHTDTDLRHAFDCAVAELENAA